MGDLDSTRFGSDSALGNLKLGGSNDPFKVSTVLDDSLDFDAVMRLPLNFDEPIDSNADSSFGPFRSTRKFDDEPSLGGIGMRDISKLNDSSSGFYTGRNGYSEMPSSYGGGLGSGMSEFSHLGSIGSSSYLPPNPPQDRFGPSGFQGHYTDSTPSLGGGYPVGFSSEVYSSAHKPPFDSMSYGVGMDAGLGSGILGGHGMQGTYRPSSGYTSAPSQQQFFAERSLDADLFPDSAFPNIAWLRKYGMGMYRYTPDASEIAMHIRNDLVLPLLGTDSSLLTELMRKSNCVVKLERQLLAGARENFLVFQSGGERSMMAIQMVVERLKNILSGPSSQVRPANGSLQPSSVGLPSSSRLNIAK